MFIKIKDAYQTLTNADSKQTYDKLIGNHHGIDIEEIIT